LFTKHCLSFLIGLGGPPDEAIHAKCADELTSEQLAEDHRIAA
jgi:hypothetical protein